MNRRQEIAAWIFGLVIALGFALTDKGIWALVVLACLTILSLRDRQKKGSKSRPAELMRTPETDAWRASEAGVGLASSLSVEIIGLAADLSQPAKSQMIFEAHFFAASYVSYHAADWYSQETLRSKFVEGLKGQFALVLAVAADSPDKEVETLNALSSEYDSLLSLREEQYRMVRESIRFRLLNLFMGEKFVNGAFLVSRITFACSQHNFTVQALELEPFVTEVTRHVRKLCKDSLRGGIGGKQ